MEMRWFAEYAAHTRNSPIWGIFKLWADSQNDVDADALRNYNNKLPAEMAERGQSPG